MIHMDNQENIENPRVASFSAYLNPSEENFVLKLTGKDHLFELVSPEDTPSQIIVGKKKTDRDGEIGVFGADKYFNTRMEQETPKLIDYCKINKAEAFKKQISTRAPSIVSEASSNSQRALLPKLSKSPSLIKGNCRRFFLGFGCNGPCLNKKSVHVKKDSENGDFVNKKDNSRNESFRFANTIVFNGEKNGQMGFKGHEFEFPVPKSKEEDLVVKKRLEEEKMEGPRHSIEVFGSSMNKKGDQVERNLERKLSMLTWDAIPKTENQASTMGSGDPFDDNQSDASSDLFEIETLSGKGNTNPKNQGCEKISCCMTPTTQYAPSEASIEWSVVTASAADFSFTSECDEKNITRDLISTLSKNKFSGRKEGQKGPGGLLGCNSHKAVNVAETAYKSADKAKLVVEGKSQDRVLRNDFEFATI